MITSGVRRRARREKVRVCAYGEVLSAQLTETDPPTLLVHQPKRSTAMMCFYDTCSRNQECSLEPKKTQVVVLSVTSLTVDKNYTRALQ